MSAASSSRESLIRSAVARSVLAVCLVGPMLVTAVWPDWIERTVGLEVDGGSGAAEWLVVGTFALLAAVAAGGAGVAWRRVVLRP